MRDRHAVDEIIYIFKSSMPQASTLAAALRPNERVLVLTANDTTLEPAKVKLFTASGIQVIVYIVMAFIVMRIMAFIVIVMAYTVMADMLMVV